MSEFDNSNKDTEVVAEVEGGNTESGDTTTSDGVETNWTEVVSSFDDMDLKEDLLRGVQGLSRRAMIVDGASVSPARCSSS